MRVRRGFNATTITAKAQNYKKGEVTVDKTFNGLTLLNIALGGIIGIGIDAATGAMMKPEFKTYYIPMERRSDAPQNYVERPYPTVD